MTLEILSYDNRLRSSFMALNKAWLEKYFSIEPPDLLLLNDPEGQIIERGGHIFFARMGDEIVGTAALLRCDDLTFELSKMAVSENYQGQKIGHRLLQFCLEKARQLGATKVILYSNTMLLPAIHLYRKFGFREVELNKSIYNRSNIKMEFCFETTEIPSQS